MIVSANLDEESDRQALRGGTDEGVPLGYSLQTLIGEIRATT
ncbi:hypothetical protein [Pseudomonas agarici]|nr:hypothetical protein [Pseudomonas agarici]